MAGEGLAIVAVLGLGGLAWYHWQRGSNGRSLSTGDKLAENIGINAGEILAGSFDVDDLLINTGPRDPAPVPEMENTSPVKLPRGIRNNNPGNIRYDGTGWQGLADPPTDGAFCIFTDPRYGIRAIARILKSYARRGVDTLPEIISTWAPATENDTQSYIYSVSSRSGLSPVGIVFEEDWPRLIEAMIWHENGQQPYTLKTIQEGVSWA